MVYINGTGLRVLNEISEADSNLVVNSYRDCNCATNYVGVSAVNRCLREGPVSNITLDQRPTSASECEPVTTIQPNDCTAIINDRNKNHSKTQQIMLASTT